MAGRIDLVSDYLQGSHSQVCKFRLMLLKQIFHKSPTMALTFC